MEFELRPRPPFHLDVVAWTLRRRPHNIVDRWDGETYRRVLTLPSGPVEVAVRQPSSRKSGRLSIRVTGQSLGAEVSSIITQQLQRLLGLRIDLAQFHEVAANDPQLSQLAQRFVGMKPPRFPTLFECLINAIACQQLSLTLGIHILNRLAVAFGVAFVGGEVTAYAFPRPEDLAGLEVCLISMNVVHAVGQDLAQLRVGKIVRLQVGPRDRRGEVRPGKFGVPPGRRGAWASRCVLLIVHRKGFMGDPRDVGSINRSSASVAVYSLRFRSAGNTSRTQLRRMPSSLA